jgi:murein DD-endopeptidase MepM/ murein hydrolase activator NlpD
MATATLAGPSAPLVAAQAAGGSGTAVESEFAIEIKAGGLPLMIGSQGELVTHVQRALGIRADAIFGPETDGAVRRFQYAMGLHVDGIVGPATWSALFAPARTAAAPGTATGGSEVPARVRRNIERRLAEAGVELTRETVGPPPEGDTRGRSDAPSGSSGGGGPLPSGDVTVGDCGSARISSPVNGTVTSGFGPRWGRHHDGVDIAAPTGTAVRAAACGTVSVRGQQSGYGNIVCVTHTSRFATCYAHLSAFAIGNGASVRQGQTIGYVGCTGSCTGPHLHFETRVEGTARDPRTYLSGGEMPGRVRARAAAGPSPSGETEARSMVAVEGGGAAGPAAPTAETIADATTAPGSGVPADETLSGQPTAPPSEVPADGTVPEGTAPPSEVPADATIPQATAPPSQVPVAATVPEAAAPPSEATSTGGVPTGDPNPATGAPQPTAAEPAQPGVPTAPGATEPAPDGGVAATASETISPEPSTGISPDAVTATEEGAVAATTEGTAAPSAG